MSQSSADPSRPAAADDLSGCVLAGYSVLSRLGRGAMAEVYLAEQRSLRRRVALKILRRDLASDPAYVARFHQEAQAAASLVHANIVQIYEIGCADGLHFIAQEYVAGANLAELIATSGAAEVELATSVARQVAAALARAAEQGVVHRDIKPENILLSAGGDVKVADFGLARLIAPEATNLTQTGFTMGTPLYMSPEQIEGRPLDVRSDLYSLGVTCYHLLAGRPPFSGQTAVQVALLHLNTDPDPLEELRPEAPREFCQIIARLMAKRPEDRYATPRQLLDALAGVAGGKGGQGSGRAAVTRSLAPPSGGSGGSSSAPNAARAHGSATERLQVLMNAPDTGTGARWGWMAAALAAAFAIGLAAAWLTHDVPLLP